MAGLPKKYAKMGFKRGWAMFKRLRNKKRKTKTIVRAQPMARRRRKNYFKKAYRKVKSGLSFGNVTKILIGAGLAVVYNVYVSPLIPVSGMLKNVLEFGIGLYLAVGRFPMPVKAFGAALATLEAYSFISGLMGGNNGGVSFDGGY